MRNFGRAAAGGALCLSALVATQATPSVVQAVTIGVTSTADVVAADGNCTLREAIVAANTDTAVDECAAGSGIDSIWLSAATYTLSSPLPDITAPVTFRGPLPTGLATIDADGSGRVFTIVGNETTALSVQFLNVVITGGVAADGAGVHATHGSLRFERSWVHGNTATGDGGGMFLDHTSATIIASTISGNSANRGGGVFSAVNNPVGSGGGGPYVTNSTISGNTASLAGVRLDNPGVKISPSIIGNTWYLRIDGYNTRAKVERIK